MYSGVDNEEQMKKLIVVFCCRFLINSIAGAYSFLISLKRAIKKSENRDLDSYSKV